MSSMLGSAKEAFMQTSTATFVFAIKARGQFGRMAYNRTPVRTTQPNDFFFQLRDDRDASRA